MNPALEPDDVAEYLKANPAFFDQYAELLSTIQVANPHGGRAIALSDRQVLALREDNRKLAAKLKEVVDFGEDNMNRSDKLQRLAVALMQARDLAAFLSSLYLHLREDFAIPHVAVRVWKQSDRDGAGRAEFEPVSDALKDYAAGLEHPYCGPSGNVEAAALFGDAASHVRSVGHLALRDGGSGVDRPCIGLLALGSEDLMRFQSDMDTLYQERLAELVSAGLARLL